VSVGAGPVLLAASPGGHLDLLRTVVPSLGERPRLWITSPGPGADGLREAGERVRLVPLPREGPRALLKNAACSLAILARERPSVIVTSGASSVLPLALAARAAATDVVFVETMARVEGFSRTGDVLRRVSRAVLVQWPDLRRHHPSAIVCRPALLESIRPPGGEPRAGTFVAVGTHDQPFDRLLGAVARAADEGVLPEPVVAQIGRASHVPAQFDAAPLRPASEIAALAGAAEVMVCHAGSGILAAGLRAGLRPLVMPRLARLGEHVDDHQLQLARRLGELGLVVEVEGDISPEHVAAARRPLTTAAEVRLPAVGTVLSAALDRIVPLPSGADKGVGLSSDRG
jgi:UDP-N-acetylglucosamine transferase subunit ALG13